MTPTYIQWPQVSQRVAEARASRCTRYMRKRTGDNRPVARVVKQLDGKWAVSISTEDVLAHPELQDEREYIKSRHPGTRNQYELAVEKTHKRLQGWLRDGMTVPDWLDQWHRGIPLDKREMTEGLLRWVGTTRRAAVWCGLCWLARRTKREEKKV